jgi:hypothetical protein
VPFVFVNRERVNGKLTGRRHVAVYIDGVGRFEIDNDEHLWTESFAESVLEYRNDTQWENAAEEELPVPDLGSERPDLRINTMSRPLLRDSS